MDRPPVTALLAYRLLGWRLGPAYGEWVHDDVTGRGWVLRQGLPALVAVLSLGTVVFLATGADLSRLYALVFILAAGSLFLRGTMRERTLRLQGLDETGGVLSDASWYADAARRRRRNLLGATSTIALVVGGLLILALRDGA